MPFNDYRTALVTGANTGMGATITETFTKRGLTVYGVARNAERLDEVAGRTGMTPLTVDVTDTAAFDRSCGRPRDRHPGQQCGGVGDRQYRWRRPKTRSTPWSTSISGPSCTCAGCCCRG